MLCYFSFCCTANRTIYMYTYSFRFCSHIGHYRVLSGISYAILQVLISYLFHTQQYVYVDHNLPLYLAFSPSVAISLFSTSVTQFLFWKQVHLYHDFFFKGSTYKQCHKIFAFSVRLTSLSLTISRSIHNAANGIILLFFMAE